MDRIDQAITRHLQPEPTDQRSAERVLAKLAAQPLPEQRRPWLHWPTALLDTDFAPAWPRLAALAAIALIGCTVGFFGPGTGTFQRSGLVIALVQSGDIGVSGLVFEPEPLTGARP